MTKTTKIKNNDRIINKYLNTSDEKKYFKKTINWFILFNLIQSKLKNKTQQCIKQTNLFNKLDEIDQNIRNNQTTTHIQNTTTYIQSTMTLLNLTNLYSTDISSETSMNIFVDNYGRNYSKVLTIVLHYCVNYVNNKYYNDIYDVFIKL